jgi:surface antigen
MPYSINVAATAVVLASLALPSPPGAYADPPAWAPAHGWRKKHDPNYVGYTGKQWPDDYGVVSGHCDYETAGAVVGAAVGGAIGSSVGKGEGKTVAVLVGTVVGAVVGQRIARSIEEQDRACIAHSLELAKDRNRVAWSNPQTGVGYLLTPETGFTRDGVQCRTFELRRSLNGQNETTQSTACQTREGAWDLVSS